MGALPGYKHIAKSRRDLDGGRGVGRCGQESSSSRGQDPPQEGPRKPQLGRALGEVIWADRRVQTEMVGCGGLAVFWVRQWRPSGIH